jgi:hypothetical protein
MAVKTFDSDMLIVVFVEPISGFEKESLVKLEREEDTWKKYVGADGEVSRSRNRNRSGSVTITLASTSASNDTLSAQHALDEATGNGAVPLLIKDLSGRTVAEAPNAWVRKLPMVEFGREVGSREWVLDCDELIMFVGGN